MASRRPTLPCAIRLSTLDVSQRRRATKISMHIGALHRAPLILTKCIVAWCQFWRAPGLSAHIFFHWHHTNSWIVTNKITLPHPPHFLGFSFSYVYTNTGIDCVIPSIRMCRAWQDCALRSCSAHSNISNQSTCYYRVPTGWVSAPDRVSPITHQSHDLLWPWLHFSFANCKTFLPPAAARPSLATSRWSISRLRIRICHFSQNLTWMPRPPNPKNNIVPVKIHILLSKWTPLFTTHHCFVTRMLCMI